MLRSKQRDTRGKGDARRVGMKIPDIEAYSHGGVRFQKDKSIERDGHSCRDRPTELTYLK